MDKISQTKEIVVLYGKVFLACSIPFGLITFVMLSGLEMLSGIFYAGVVSLIIVTVHIVTVRQLPFGKQPGALQVHQTRSIEIKLPDEVVFNLCLEFILIRGATIHLRNHELGKIMAKTSAGMKTGGNTISLNVYAVGGGTTRVTVSSKPTMSATWVDYGSNLETVNNITAFLKLKEEQALAKT